MKWLKAITISRSWRAALWALLQGHFLDDLRDAGEDGLQLAYDVLEPLDAAFQGLIDLGFDGVLVKVVPDPHVVVALPDTVDTADPLFDPQGFQARSKLMRMPQVYKLKPSFPDADFNDMNRPEVR